MSVTVAIIPIRADAYAGANRPNLHAHGLRVGWCEPCRTDNRECGYR
jgi:hypothetical protein